MSYGAPSFLSCLGGGCKIVRRHANCRAERGRGNETDASIRNHDFLFFYKAKLDLLRQVDETFLRENERG